ncbi:hypothetical protein Dxin01_00125 [Deinococcus xinjiangensis]|uniref:Uncharacterized protein n=1 Tax=Deinococcus xinjiangensis TaxID=457454 RepID=A0ABP9V546_9DEIO
MLAELSDSKKATYRKLSNQLMLDYVRYCGHHFKITKKDWEMLERGIEAEQNKDDSSHLPSEVWDYFDRRSEGKLPVEVQRFFSAVKWLGEASRWHDYVHHFDREALALIIEARIKYKVPLGSQAKTVRALKE